MKKKRLISLLNLSCNDFDSLTSILNQKKIIICNKRMTEKDLKNSKGEIYIDCLYTTTEETLTIKCYNSNGKLSKFKLVINI